MQISIAQTLALAMHGNAFLRGRAVEPFFRNSTCRLCSDVGFAARGRLWLPRGRIVAATPDEWFAQIRRRNIGRLIVEYSPSSWLARMPIGLVGGGGHWRIGIMSGRSGPSWEGKWRIGNRQDPEHRVWSVTYRGAGRIESAHRVTVDDLERFVSGLTPAFEDIAAFARERGQKDFAEAFGRAVSCLGSDDPRQSWDYPDLAPPGLPLAADRILGAAQVGWVFGGMGSWEDLRFREDVQRRYEDLSCRLRGLLSQATVAAANASAE